MTTFPIAFEFQNCVLGCCGALSAVGFSAGAAESLGSWHPFCHHEVKTGCEWMQHRRLMEREGLVVHTLLLVSARENCPSSPNESAGRGVRGQNLISQEERNPRPKDQEARKSQSQPENPVFPVLLSTESLMAMVEKKGPRKGRSCD